MTCKMSIFKRYSLSLIGLTTILLFILITVGFFLEPLSGDLTRLGWYSEYNFGWNEPQKAFNNELFSREKTYQRYADVVVIGDSFSMGEAGYEWPNFFVAQTGLSVAAFGLYGPDLKFRDELLPEIINSEAFQREPPRIVVFEKIERWLDKMGNAFGDCQASYPNPPGFLINMQPVLNSAPLHDVVRKKSSLSIQNIAYAGQFLNKLMFERRSHSIVKRLDLDNLKFFSSRQSNTLLLYKHDLRKASWDTLEIAKIKCILLNMQNLVQANGKTLFIAMIVPDKLTAYSHHLMDRAYANLSVFDALAAEQSLNLVRLDWAMQAAIDQGMIDIYLPNDTHWGYRGHQIAAASLAQYLRMLSGLHGNDSATIGVTSVINSDRQSF